jgi:hypothetical protein
MTSALRVHFRPAAADIPAELWARCFAAETEGYFWFELLERSELDDQFEFAYAVVYRHDDPVAIAPVFLMDLTIDIAAPPALMPIMPMVKRIAPKLYTQRTLFIGAPGADESALGLVAGGNLVDVVRAVTQAALERAKEVKASLVVWKDFPSQYWPSLRACKEQWRLFELVSFPNTRIDNPGSDFDAYLQGLSSDNRSKLRRKLRRSRVTCDLRPTVVDSVQPELIDEIWPLYAQTFAKADMKFERLTKAFFSHALSLENSVIVLLRDGASERPVAFMLCFLLGRRAVNKYIGIDYGYLPKSFLYFRLFEEFVRWAQAVGASELQSGQTVYRAKLDLGHQLIPLSHFVHHRNWLVHHAFAFIARYVDWSTLDTGLRDHVEARARRKADPARVAIDRNDDKSADSSKLGRSIEQ